MVGWRISLSNETYKDGDTLVGTEEGPLIHGREGGVSGTVRTLRVSSAGAGQVEVTNETIQQTTTVDHDGLNLVVGGITTDTTGTVEPLKMNAEGIHYVVDWNALVPEKVDNISLGYDGSTLTSVVYVYSSVTQATLTLAYDGSNLTSVVKT